MTETEKEFHEACLHEGMEHGSNAIGAAMRAFRRLNRDELPKIPGHVGANVYVAADESGELYRIDAENGTIRRLHWERS